MTLFAELAKMLDKPGKALALNVIALEGGKLALTVLPKGEWKDAALGAGLAVQATPEELDAHLIEQLARYTSAHKSLAEQVQSTVDIIAAAQRENAAKAQSAIKKATTPTTAAAKTTPSAAAPGNTTPATAVATTTKATEQKDTVDLF